ncbi:nucleosome assembly protein 1-like 1-A [Agrilus planipennis]|uniref:Nucleosome assembly protein 1-like 1-A n=2 Tax=Agrilus planipennis TaxID=224129 RepID=A0A1W4XL05_AGRPL|nr:nucleosome assembly protein 1-like 1-A [Agrilus planipennis]XP_018333060.1 nucleosome assembly protein 1-like 1-A [Agrilus planipennis]XP_025832601.1 nucleosome assembly protein 1-like 1-A [Agrilus planipennis]
MAEIPDQAGDCPDDLENVGEEEIDNDIEKKAAEVARNFVAALTHQQRDPAEIIAALPPECRKRVKALKKLQVEELNLEAKFYEEVHALEVKYSRLYSPLHEKRFSIISGAYEPTEEECQWASADEEDLANELNQKAKVGNEGDKKEEQKGEPVKGIPDFWLTIFKNVSLLYEMVQEHDEPILKHLLDIKLKFKDNPMGFILEFYFEPNEYFTNKVLTKEYDMKCVPEDDDPFSFEGPEIFRCRGCTINWNKGKNVTLKTIKKKQRHKSRDLVRTVTKTVQNDSFFNFFSPPVIPDDVNEANMDEEIRNILTSDFEIGHYIRERIIPRAALYFTGDATEDDDFEEEEADEDDEEEEEETDSDGQPELSFGSIKKEDS